MLEEKLKNECWHLVCHRAELPLPNDFIRLSWLGEDLVIYNDAGDLTVFDNLCPHRGTRFFVERRGNAPALCPYHGWRFRNGKIHVARKETFRDCDVTQARINRFNTEWCGDFLFAAIDPRASLREQVGDLAPVLEDMSFDIDRAYDLNSQLFHCNWRIPVENALESYHVDMVHPETLGHLKLTPGKNEFFERNSVLWSEVGNERTTKHLETLARFFSLKRQFKGYVSVYVFPFAMLTSTYGYSYALQHFLPDENPNQTNFSSRLLISRTRDAASWDALLSFFDSTAQINRKVFEEDHEICRRVFSKSTTWNRPSFFSTHEEKIKHFRDSLRSFEANVIP